MQNITIDNASDYTINGTVDVANRITVEGESKTVTLRLNFNNVSLRDVINKSCKPQVISWQNNVGRPKFGSIKAGSVISVDWASPAKKVKTPEEQIAELKAQFMKAGLDDGMATELATKAVMNPELTR